MRWLLFAVVLAAGGAQAQELTWQGLPSDQAPTRPTVEAEMGSLITTGDGRRMRELARTPTWLWGTARAFVPLDSPRLFGQLRLEVTTMGTGFVSLDSVLGDGSRLVIRLSRYRFPFAQVRRVAEAALPEDAAALDQLEESHENAEVRYERPVGPLGGRLDLALDFERIAGTRPMLAAGLVGDSPLGSTFGNSAYRKTDDLGGGATIGYSVAPRGVRLRIVGGVRLDRPDDRLLLRDRVGTQASGLADLHDHGRERTVEVAASASSDRPAPLMAGASYRLSHTANAPHLDRQTNSDASVGSVRSDDEEVRVLRQHGAAAVVWQAIPGLVMSGRLDARLTDLDAHASQARDLGTPELVRADASRDNWSLDGRVQGRYDFLASSAVELDARGGLRRGDDDWNLRYLLSDGITDAGQRTRNLERRMLAGVVELRLLLRPLARLRVSAGMHLEGLRDDQDVDRLIDAFRLGNRSRTQAGGFLTARTRPWRRLMLDGRATLFRDTWASAGGKDDNWRFDVRLRATATAGPLMVFALGALTEDRHELSGGQALPGFAALDFTGRSWLGVGGASATLATSAWITATYTLVANTVDLTTRLHDAALAGNLLLPWKRLRLQLSARYLAFHDRAPVPLDGQAVLLLATVAGSF